MARATVDEITLGMRTMPPKMMRHPSLGPQTALAVKLCHVHGITLAFPNSRRRAIGAAVEISNQTTI